MSDSFLLHLEARLTKNASLPKRERTRERLRIATVQVLNECGYDEMRALTITEKAGLSEGLFYVYFKSKTDITLDLLSEFYNDFVRLNGGDQPSTGQYDAIKTANRRWLHIAAANLGLMRCIFQAGNEVPEFAALISAVNKSWYALALAAVERNRSIKHKNTMLLPLYMLGGMMDELARKLIVYPDPELLAVIDESGADYDVVADAATMIWQRVLYIDDQNPAQMSDLAKQLFDSV